MWSLQSSVSIASDAAVDQSLDCFCSQNGTESAATWLRSRVKGRYVGAGINVIQATSRVGVGIDVIWATGRYVGAGIDAISHLTEEFQQRAEVFADDAKFLVEIKSGQEEANLDPVKELKKLKQTFESWKKDFSMRLGETRIIINKLSGEDSIPEKSKKWCVNH